MAVQGEQGQGVLDIDFKMIEAMAHRGEITDTPIMRRQLLLILLAKMEGINKKNG